MMEMESDVIQNEQTFETEAVGDLEGEGAIEAEVGGKTNGETKHEPKTKSKGRRSTVWNYFDKIEEKIVICRLCRKSFKFCGNTTNLNSHIKRAHPDESPSSDYQYEITTRKRSYSDVISETPSQYGVTAEPENNAAIQIVYSDPTHATVSNLGRGEQQYVRGVRPLVTKLAPPWEGTAVVDGEFVTLKSSDYRGKYLVLLFYPLAFAYESPTEILKFNERLTDFKILDTEIVACSIDSHFTQLAWNKTSRKMGGLGNVDIPLLSDVNHKVSKSYGVFVEDLGYSLRATFVIDTKGILRHMTVTDLSEGCNVNEVLRLIQSFYDTDARDSTTYKT